MLTIIYPDVAIWDQGLTKYIYPFIFNSDSDWTVDVCAQVPSGYQIEGILDENGNLVANSGCTQAFVAGQTKVVAFSVLETSSPAPEFTAKITAKHKGKVQKADINIKGGRRGKDVPTLQEVLNKSKSNGRNK